MGYFEGFGDYNNTTGDGPCSSIVVNGNSARWQTGHVSDTQSGNTTLVWNGNLNALLRGGQTSVIEGFKFLTVAGASFATNVGANVAIAAAGVFEIVAIFRLTVFTSLNITSKKGVQVMVNMGRVYEFHNSDTFLWTDNASNVVAEQEEFKSNVSAYYTTLKERTAELKRVVIARYRETVEFRRLQVRNEKLYEVSRMDIGARSIQFNTLAPLAGLRAFSDLDTEASDEDVPVPRNMQSFAMSQNLVVFDADQLRVGFVVNIN